MGIAIGGFHDFIWHAMLFLVNLVILAAHKPLDRENGVGRISYGLTFRRLTDQPLTIFRKGDNGRGRARAFAIF